MVQQQRSIHPRPAVTSMSNWQKMQDEKQIGVWISLIRCRIQYSYCFFPAGYQVTSGDRFEATKIGRHCEIFVVRFQSAGNSLSCWYFIAWFSGFINYVAFDPQIGLKQKICWEKDLWIGAVAAQMEVSRSWLLIFTCKTGGWKSIFLPEASSQGPHLFHNHFWEPLAVQNSILLAYMVCVILYLFTIHTTYIYHIYIYIY